jgi:hypothetical protein
MADTFKPTPADTYTGSTYGSAPNNKASYEPTEGTGDIGKTLLIGVLGGILSAAGYMVYQRLPDEHKERLHSQARTMLQQRINEIRSNFNI